MRSQVIKTFIPWAEPEQQSAAYKLFHNSYLCRMAQIHLYDLEYLRDATMVTTGRPDWDRELAQQMVTVQLTPAAMATFVHEGAQFRLVNPEDAVVIYRTIKEHLQNWLGEVEVALHRRTPPLAALRAFDELAAAIYPYAKQGLIERPFHGRLGDFVANLSRARGGMTRQLQMPVTEDNPAPQAPAHTPFADSIARLDSERKKQWS